MITTLYKGKRIRLGGRRVPSLTLCLRFAVVAAGMGC